MPWRQCSVNIILQDQIDDAPIRFTTPIPPLRNHKNKSLNRKNNSHCNEYNNNNSKNNNNNSNKNDNYNIKFKSS